MGAFYSTVGEGIQASLTSKTIFWSLTILLVIIILAVIFIGAKKLFTSGRLKWLLLHTASVFVVGYSLRNVTLNKYVELLIFALVITVLAALYRYLMYHKGFKWKSFLKWVGINIGIFYFLLILFEVVSLTNNLLRILYAGMALTIVGALFHKKSDKRKK